jgi:SAM-dependent methyltransferase
LHHEGVTPSDREAETRRIAAGSSDDDPTGWFEQLYTSARSGGAVIPWERGGPHPLLSEWTTDHAVDGHGRAAVVVGCGLGYDAEHLAGVGFATTAFDVSPTGVASAAERHPGSEVDYVTADLLALPADWQGAFDLVLESLTVQSMPVAFHERAIQAVCSLVAPGGTLLVIAGSRDEGSEVQGPPWPLTESEIQAFASGGLRLVHVEQLTDANDPATRRWRVELRRD